LPLTPPLPTDALMFAMAKFLPPAHFRRVGE
jgi:hypothetical protein